MGFSLGVDGVAVVGMGYTIGEMMQRRSFLAGTVTAMLMGRSSLVRTTMTLPVGMTRRTIPAGYASAGRTYVHRTEIIGNELFVGFHGATGTVTNINADWWKPGNGDGWSHHAQAHAYQLILCEAIGGKWNVGGGWPSNGQDDVQYAQDVLVDYMDVSERLLIPTYACGFSNGGAMAWKLACEVPGSFSGAIISSGWATTYPTAPIDVWHQHGTSDPAVPNRGGPGIYGVIFPDMSQEAARAPRYSRVVHYMTSGGHGVPGWMADQMLKFARETVYRP